MVGSDEEDLTSVVFMMKALIILSVVVCMGLKTQARLMAGWSYNMLNDKAALVVIAKPFAVTNTSERAALPDIMSGTNEIIAAGVETSFKVLTVLKGDRSLQTFVLHHYARLPLPSNVAEIGSPELVDFASKSEKTFLLFLVPEPDGRFVAVSGQTDPFWSVIEFGGRRSLYFIPDPDPKNLPKF